MTAPYIRRESSPFLKRVLIPFWNLRIVILLAGLASNGLLLAALILITDDVLSYESQYNTKLALDIYVRRHPQDSVIITLVHVFLLPCGRFCTTLVKLQPGNLRRIRAQKISFFVRSPELG